MHACDACLRQACVGSLGPTISMFYVDDLCTVYRVSQKKVLVFDYIYIKKIEQLLHSNKLYFILVELT